MSGHLGKNFDVRMQNGAICHLNIKIWGTFENWGAVSYTHLTLPTNREV